MRAEALWLSVALLSMGCATVRERPLWMDSGPPVRQRPVVERDAGSSGPGDSARLTRRQRPLDHSTRSVPDAAGEARGHEATRLAVTDAVAEVTTSLSGVDAALARIEALPPTLGGWGMNGVFSRYLDHGREQLPWIRDALEGTTRLAEVASELSDSHMELGVLRMTGPRLQAALFSTLLLETWVDFLQLSDAVLRQCPMCSVEKVFVDLHRVQGLMSPTLTELASLDPERVEKAATAMPELMGRLTREFDAIQADARASMKFGEKVIAAAQVLEMLTMISTLKMSLPRLPPAAPATLGVGLVMSSSGVMVGSRIVVSAEWVEMMRRLVQAGVISVPAISAAVRIHGGQVLMAQAHQDLPKGVREALGDSPEVRGMHVTGKAGAGMSEPPKHHILPQEHREWFEQRGFTGEMSIDQFCVRMERSNHEAIHGGGNWQLGRLWPGEWNRLIMDALLKAEARAGVPLSRDSILRIVGENMNSYNIPMNFIPGKRR
ncbi:hypothetical protein MYSTI_00179 [Myxococcus stipitatus DSM 14675]|uniref:DUF2380 domain-containing protein n=1 Tax=Myxococcus stipitatus (strain DSM 14675 / JCM 12634 / Mx s8) TaxID=1278073 RepID=L7TZY4_MYXSD|nr:DUF2380 domain-containing protein [Myxococcus stipitatus]AGC41538.1 hypothetical protein MYSTI_00179 [Myxococcus stipitatus DSM 14675]